MRHVHGVRVKESATVPEKPVLNAASGFRVLVAEDNSVNQLLTLTQLKKLGYSAHAVANGQEVLEALRTGVYDIILMDCQMPEMDGYEATAAIRRQEADSGTFIPIIALTANAMQQDRDHCLEAGMNDFVAKPTKTDSLGEVLVRWLKNPETKAG